MNVAIIGKGRDCPSHVLDLATMAGRAVAELGHVTVTGGLGGVMRAALAGAASAGGIAIGLVPGLDDPAPLNGVTFLRTGLSVPTRNVVMGSVADVVVVLPGSHGTMQEWAVAHDRGVPIAKLGKHDGFLTSMIYAPFLSHVADLDAVRAVVSAALDAARS